MAQTYSFSAAGKEYILRVCTDNFEATYQKEAFIHQHFSSPEIPIPAVLATGQLNDTFYAITEKKPGCCLDFLSREEYIQLLPSLAHTLYAIHQVDVASWSGFGWFANDGTGMFPSWKVFIAHIIEEERSDGFYGKWHTLFDTTFLDRTFFEKTYTHMLRLLEFCSEERHLVHGEYGYNNLLAQDGQVTAVLDWIDASYGDFVYDIAGIDFWPPHGLDFVDYFRRYYAEKGKPLPNYMERITCYKLYLGLDSMRFFAKTDNLEAYQATCRKIQGFLAHSPLG